MPSQGPSSTKAAGWIVLSIAAILGLLAGCANGGEAAAAPDPALAPTTSTAPPPVAGEVWGAVTSLAQSPSAYNVLGTMVSVVADQPVAVRVTATSGDQQVHVPITGVATSHDVAVVGMRAASTYQIGVNAIGADGAVVGGGTVPFTSGELPAFIPDLDVRVAADGRSAGYTLVEVTPVSEAGLGASTDDPRDRPSVVAVDSEGQVVWYQSDGGPMNDVELTDRGTLLHVNSPSGVTEEDLLGNELRSWEVEPELMPWQTIEADQQDPARAGPRPSPRPTRSCLHADWVDLRSVHHEVTQMPNGNLLALGTTLHELTESQRETLCPGDADDFWATSDVAFEFTPEGEVLRTWDVWDAVDIMKTPGQEMCVSQGQFASAMERDWTHANAVVYDAARDAVIVSSRHTSQTIAFDHGDSTRCRNMTFDGSSGRTARSPSTGRQRVTSTR